MSDHLSTPPTLDRNSVYCTRESAAAALDTPSRAMLDAPARDEPHEGVFTLPGGYLDDDGALHREVQLSPLTGRDEEFLAHLDAQTCAASVVTRLLARRLTRIGAIREIDAALVRRLLVGDRDYLLLKLRRISFGERIYVVSSCAAADCGKPLEFKISLDDIPCESKPVAARYFTMRLSPDAALVDDAGRAHVEVEFRLPTGEDQEAAAPLFRRDEPRAVDQLLARCIRRVGELSNVDGALVAMLPAQARREIEEQIELRSPQAELELEGICPECETPFTHLLNFTDYFASEVQKNLRDLEHTVHFLAWHYHWSERAILSLTMRKRRRYVELLREELERLNS